MYQEMVRAVRRVQNQKQYSKTVRACCNYISLHIEEPLSLEILASQMGYTKYYLSRCFKAETGMTLNHYIQQERVEQAAILLTFTSLSVQEIAVRLQFTSPSHFSTVFKHGTGMNPTQYRQENQTV